MEDFFLGFTILQNDTLPFKACLLDDSFVFMSEIVPSCPHLLFTTIHYYNKQNYLKGF